MKEKSWFLRVQFQMETLTDQLMFPYLIIDIDFFSSEGENLVGCSRTVSVSWTHPLHEH